MAKGKGKENGTKNYLFTVGNGTQELSARNYYAQGGSHSTQADWLRFAVQYYIATVLNGGRSGPNLHRSTTFTNENTAPAGYTSLHNAVIPPTSTAKPERPV